MSWIAPQIASFNPWPTGQAAEFLAFGHGLNKAKFRNIVALPREVPRLYSALQLLIILRSPESAGSSAVE
jgi:hypothetical protein